VLGLILVSASCTAAAETRQSSADAWIGPMREVHARFTGQPGTLALFGDSITVSQAFWSPLAGRSRGLSERLAADRQLVEDYLRPECWRDWRGPEYGNEGRMTIRWADENVAAWLERLNPEVAVLMFGTNDLSELERDEYTSKTETVVKRCLENGTIVILTTIPPRHGMAEKASEFAAAARAVAHELHVPLVDYQAEILRRRPRDWDGALAQFNDAPGDEYNVPTLISRDGVHPSNPQDHRDFSEAGLSRNGYSLRSVLTLAAYARVIREVLKPDEPAHE
jgi:lysophospholipase L1-like esterase